jgi:hypothetical protein
MDNIKQLYEQLKAPFEVDVIGWKINNYNSDKTKAMITFHIDARAAQDRLNTVLGLDGWSFIYTELEKDSGVHGKLEVPALGGITREDVGYANDSAKGEWYKDAVSDALKRCAVHLGVGHFLYSLPSLWLNLETTGQKFLSKTQNDDVAKWLGKQIGAKKVELKPEVEVGKVLDKDAVDHAQRLVKVLEDIESSESTGELKRRWEGHSEFHSDTKYKDALQVKKSKLVELEAAVKEAAQADALGVSETNDSIVDEAGALQKKPDITDKFNGLAKSKA